ncbi:nucleoside/nucleotide kinase family protein [Arsenicicoccus dermatophilus]|uniref:nucleoside/nucleotide kinase family protein n=1 Tax=Arsenicicoccus dermatophilus TaxID=1076331 RepID=UPI003916D118
MPTLTEQSAVARAASLAARPGRTILGLAGAPAAGKSTLAATLAAAVPGAVVVGMDGWHLAHSVLVARGDVADKGAPWTFDGDGYLALLRRVRAAAGPVWAPEFRRELEDAVAGAVLVAPGCPLVITEGNYLLLDEEPWRSARALCDEVWQVSVPEPLRVDRLVARHVAHGRTPEAARERATHGIDAANARLVLRMAARADAVVTLS